MIESAMKNRRGMGIGLGERSYEAKRKRVDRISYNKRYRAVT